MNLRMTLMTVLAVCSLAACGGGKKNDTTGGGGGGEGGGGGGAATASLYDRLGGKDGITAVVDQFVAAVVADDRINTFFKNADAANLKKKLVEQISNAAGCVQDGKPCPYTGKDMKTAHAGMGIKEADFNALVEDLSKTLDAAGVKEKEKGELLGALGPLKSQIVTK
jgi:hemoglobin